MLILGALCLLLSPLGSPGHQYPPVPFHPLHPLFPPPHRPIHAPGPPAPPGPPGPYQLRDQSHAYPALLPPQRDGPPPPPLPPGSPSSSGIPPGGPVGSANRPAMPHRPPQWTSVLGHQRPMDDMVDITNELGVSVLQDYAYSRGNFAFSPYGVASVLVVLYEGARGETARQVHATLKLPWDRDVLRVGFRDIHRNLRSYFTHEGYLSGVTLSQSRSALIPEFRRVLRFYGYDVDSPPEGFNYSTPAPAAPADPPSLTVEAEELTSHKQPVASNNATVSINATTATATTIQNGMTLSPAPESTPSPTTTTAPSSSATSTPSSPVGTSTLPSPMTEVPMEMSNVEDKEASGTTSTPATTTSPSASHESENEVEADAPLSLLSPSLLQQRFPGILMGSRLQEQLNSLFPEGLPEGLPEARVDDVELLEPTTKATSSSTTSVTTQSSDSSTLSESPLVGEQEQEDSNPEPTVESILSTESPTESPTELPTGSPTELFTESSTLSATESTTETPIESTTPPVETTSTPTTTWTTILPSTTSQDVLAGQLQEDPESDPGPEPDPEPDSETTTTAPSESPTTPSPTTSTTTSPTTSPTTTPAATVSAEEPQQVRRKARLPGPALSFWTGLEAAAAHNSTRGRSRRDLNGGFPDLSLQLQNGMFDSHVATGDELFRQLPKQPFLVDGTFEEPVPVMEYTSSFPFAYIPRLHALALEFPLDDERYRLLLLLPVERQGLRQLLHSLGRVPLRDVQRALRPTRVHAVVPAFMVEGFVILTPTLQQLGIWDMFDPRRADLSGMTDDPDLYVRNIEQAVTVVVKNYVEILDIQTRTTAARSRLDQFVATHPFLYFVMDSETQVSLMAGKVVDPLNSRIY